MPNILSRLLPFLLATTIVSQAQAGESLRVAYEDKALPPYYIGDSVQVDPVSPGISVELVRMAGEALGIEVQLVRMPWTRCLNLLQKGEVDAIFNASFKEDRLDNGVYPTKAGKPDPARRIATVAYSLYAPSGSAVTWDGKALNGISGSVGTPAGYSIGDDLARIGVKVEEAPDTVANFRKLSSGRIAAVATLDTSGDALLASGQYPRLIKIEPALSTKDYFLMISHQYYAAKRPLAERLWQTIADLREKKGADLRVKYAR